MSNVYLNVKQVVECKIWFEEVFGKEMQCTLSYSAYKHNLLPITHLHCENNGTYHCSIKHKCTYLWDI